MSDNRLLIVALHAVISLTATACTIEKANLDLDANFHFDAGADSSADHDDSGTPDTDDGGSLIDAGVSKPDAGRTEPSLLTPADVPETIAHGRCRALEKCVGTQLLVDAYEGNDCVEFLTKQLADRQLHWLAESV